MFRIKAGDDLFAYLFADDGSHCLVDNAHLGICAIAQAHWIGHQPVMGPCTARYPDLGDAAQIDAADLLEVPADLPVRPWYLRDPDAKPQ